MSEPPRLLEGSADELERQLLRAGAAYAASPELRQKTLAALGVTGVTAAAIGLGAGAALSTPPAKLGFGSLLAKWGASKVAAFALGVSAAVAVPLAVVGSRSTLTEAPRAVVAPPSRPPAALVPPVVPAPAVLPETPSPVAPLVPPVPARAAPAGDKPSASEALRVELAQLEAARSKLKSGRSEEALALLDAYERAAPRGALRLEAEVLRIDALSRSGRTAQAKSRARVFLERHPKSVLAARVRRLAGL